MFSLHDIVAVAIQIEQNGEQTYREAAAKVGDPELAELLTRLAEQEVAHVAWFTELQEALPAAEVKEELAEMGEALLLDIIGDERFSLADVDLTASQGVKEVLTAAIELERDTALFYDMIGSFLSDPVVSDQLERIIAEETAHEQRLKAYLDGDESWTGDS